MPYIQEQRPRVTIVPKARINLKQEGYIIDYFVTGWREPNHILKTTVVQEPLEDGALVSDHLVVMPVELEMMGMVSDVKDGGDAPARAWGKVRELHANKALLNVFTEWGHYEDMVIKSAETKQTGRGMQFNIHFQEIIRVGINIHEIVNPDKPDVEEKEALVVLNPATNATLAPNEISGVMEDSGQDVSDEALENNWQFFNHFNIVR